MATNKKTHLFGWVFLWNKAGAGVIAKNASMAEITTQSSGRAGVARLKKLSTRIDLTPMVDLGFLLITFFIFTTTLSQPNALKLNMPTDSKDSTAVAESKTLTMVLAPNNMLYYYKGEWKGDLVRSSYKPAEIREVINRQMQQVAQKFDDRYQTVVLIKATGGASYANVVDVLDEMVINGVSRYVLMDADPREEQFLSEL